MVNILCSKLEHLFLGVQTHRYKNRKYRACVVIFVSITFSREFQFQIINTLWITLKKLVEFRRIKWISRRAMCDAGTVWDHCSIIFQYNKKCNVMWYILSIILHRSEFHFCAKQSLFKTENHRAPISKIRICFSLVY